MLRVQLDFRFLQKLAVFQNAINPYGKRVQGAFSIGFESAEHKMFKGRISCEMRPFIYCFVSNLKYWISCFFVCFKELVTKCYDFIS